MDNDKPRLAWHDSQTFLVVPWEVMTIAELKCLNEAYCDGDTEAWYIPMDKELTLSEALQQLPVIA